MRNSTIGITVAGILAAAASTTASANNYTLYVSGASAQRSFWEADTGFLCTGTRATPAAKWTVIPSTQGGDAVAVALPDIEAVQCTVTTGAQLGASTVLTIGDTITLQYAAELGSVWGIAPFISGNAAQVNGRHFLAINDPTVCPAGGGACTVNGYVRATDAFTTGLDTAVAPDLGVTDAEPALWQFGDNWPQTTTGHVSYPALADAGGAPPTAAEVKALSYNRVNGQVLSIIVNTGGPAASVGNLSKASIAAILVGKYTTWGGVPEVAGGNTTPIKLCRRDHGSGTEVTASVTFVGSECNPFGTSPIARLRNGTTLASVGKLGAANIVENPTTNDLVSCVQANVGAIGFRSLSISSGYKTLQIDGVEANAHNAAAGTYPYAYDAFTNISPTLVAAGTSGKLDMANALITDAKTGSFLSSETGTLSGFLFTAGGGAKGTFFGQYGVGGTAAPSLTSNWAITTGGAPESLWDNGGTSCNFRYNQQTP
jgi:hypothetical protein